MTNHILNNDGKTLQNLFQKVALLSEFNHIFAQYVEPTIVAHCKVANLQNNCLIVIVDSGNWATQLRFLIGSCAMAQQHEQFRRTGGCMVASTTMDESQRTTSEFGTE